MLRLDKCCNRVILGLRGFLLFSWRLFKAGLFAASQSKKSIIVALCLAVVACGGGSDGSSDGIDDGNNTGVVNQAPSISGSPDASVVAGQTYSFSPTATDPDGDSLTFSGINLPNWASLDESTGAFAGMPVANDVGDYHDIEVCVSDGEFTACLATFIISVVAEDEAGNQAPTISGIPATGVEFDQTYNFTPTANDPDGDMLSFSIDNCPVWALCDGATGTITGTPTAGDAGSYSGIEVCVSDVELTNCLPTFSIEVVQQLAECDDITVGIGNVYWMPYLQVLTHDNVKIRWATTGGGASRVDYSVNCNDWISEDASAKTDQRIIDELDITLHTVELSGLNANTLYHYKIYVAGVEKMSGFSFKTAPALTTDSEPVDFIVIGDYGQGGGTAAPKQLELRDRLAEDAQGLLIDTTTGTPYARPSFVVTAGDNVYTSGTYAEYDEKSLQLYGELTSRTGFYPAVGDHELEEAAAQWDAGNLDAVPAHFEIYDLLPGPIDEDTHFPNLREPGGLNGHHYSFDYGNVHVAVIDYQYISFDNGIVYNVLHDDGNGSSALSNVQSWLEADLAGRSDAGQWLVVVTHHIYFFNGQRSAWGNDMHEIYERHGVDLLFSGDSHQHERSFPMNDLTPIEDRSGDGLYPIYTIAGAGGSAQVDCSNGFWVDYAYCEQSPGAMYGRVRTYENDNGKQCIQIRGIDHEGTTQDAYDYCKQ